MPTPRPGRQVPAAAAAPIARSASEGERRVRRMPTPRPGRQVPAAAAAPIARSASEGERRVRRMPTPRPGRQVPAAAAAPIARSASEGERRVRRMPTPRPGTASPSGRCGPDRKERKRRRTSRPPNANSAPRTASPSGRCGPDRKERKRRRTSRPPNANSAPRTASPSGRCGPDRKEREAKANVASAECQLRAPDGKSQRPLRPRSQGAQAKAYFPYAERSATPRARPQRSLGGGERGIRTLGTLSGSRTFQARAFSHSAISPRRTRPRGGSLQPPARRASRPETSGSSGDRAAGWRVPAADAAPIARSASEGVLPVRRAPRDAVSGVAAAAGWRRGRDSNPRYSFPYAGLANLCLQPLGHLSRTKGGAA